MSLIAELERVSELLASATEGPWRWSENGNILGHMPNGYDDQREVCAVYTDNEETGEPNAPAIVASVNFLRDHGRALMEALEDAERYRWVKARTRDKTVMDSRQQNGPFFAEGSIVGGFSCPIDIDASIDHWRAGEHPLHVVLK